MKPKTTKVIFTLKTYRKWTSIYLGNQNPNHCCYPQLPLHPPQLWQPTTNHRHYNHGLQSHILSLIQFLQNNIDFTTLHCHHPCKITIIVTFHTHYLDIISWFVASLDRQFTKSSFKSTQEDEN